MNKVRVLFVCVGNACRSQMAEGFAKAYGGDVMEAMSSGLEPYTHVPAGTRETMLEKGISMETHYPKHLAEFDPKQVDLVVNMSGTGLDWNACPVKEWPVKDPFGGDTAAYRMARDRVEKLVMELVLEVRQGGVERRG